MGRCKNVEVRNLSRAEDLRLIALVRNWPALYDPEHVSYMDNTKKVAIWSKIGEALEIDPKNCRNRWYNIRDNYRKAMIRNHKKQQLGREVKVYKYTNSLSFLRAHFNLKLDDELGHESEPDGGYEDASDAQIEFVDELANKIKTGLDYDIPSKCVKLELGSEEPCSSQLQSPQLQSEGSFLTSDGPHPVDSFLTCVGQTLKTLPPYFLSLAKAEIFATVHKYELRMYSPDQDKTAAVSSSDPLLVPKTRPQSSD